MPWRPRGRRRTAGVGGGVTPGRRRGVRATSAPSGSKPGGLWRRSSALGSVSTLGASTLPGGLTDEDGRYAFVAGARHLAPSCSSGTPSPPQAAGPRGQPPRCARTCTVGRWVSPAIGLARAWRSWRGVAPCAPVPTALGGGSGGDRQRAPMRSEGTSVAGQVPGALSAHHLVAVVVFVSRTGRTGSVPSFDDERLHRQRVFNSRPFGVCSAVACVCVSSCV